MDNFNFKRIEYHCYPIRKPKTERVINGIGFDSEADRQGKTFLFCLSTGDYFTPDTLLKGLFSRKYRGGQYVVYNLKYEMGAILQTLPLDKLERLRQTGEVRHLSYRFKTVGYKCLRIAVGKHSVTFWDMFPFYNMSLASAARHFTTLTKLEQDVTLYTPEYINSHWQDIVAYCIRDAQITAQLFQGVKAMANRLGINPTTFYSIATISYKYVRENTKYVTVKRFWDDDRKVLEAACGAYSGGKFEVTTKGKGYFYEYDINSAYPHEIANLVDISKATVKYTTKFQPKAVYGFLKCRLAIKRAVHHSVAYKRGNVNLFPMGLFIKWVTKEEYEYLSQQDGVDITVLRGVWLFVDKVEYPYRKIVNKLYKLKARAKVEGDDEFYYFTKKVLNSIYGKFVQLIARDDKLIASTCWQPVYGAITTANVRLRLARLQNDYPRIAAVHTDSVISEIELPLPCSDVLGEWSLTVQGLGVILGSGVYQIGEKIRFRGFPTHLDLLELLNKSPPIITIADNRPLSWREVVFHHWEGELINRFVDKDKELNINFDTKRDWFSNWEDGDDALSRVLESQPKIVFA